MNDLASQMDPRGLIRESYRMQGVSAAECRSIFLDWVLGFEQDFDLAAAMTALLGEYGAEHPNHPMTQLLREGVSSAHPGAHGRQRGRRRRMS